MTIEEIENAILNLSQDDFSKLREWILELDNQQWDQQLEEDIKQGKLDKIAEAAIADFNQGNYQKI